MAFDTRMAGDDVTNQALHDVVLEQLDKLDQVAASGAPARLLPAARRGLYQLAEGFRALLDEHRPDEDGRCPVCPGLLRGRRWPCTVWATAHRHLLRNLPESAPPEPAADPQARGGFPSNVHASVDGDEAPTVEFPRPTRWP